MGMKDLADVSIAALTIFLARLIGLSAVLLAAALLARAVCRNLSPFTRSGRRPRVLPVVATVDCPKA